jgi:hypothetical protein
MPGEQTYFTLDFAEAPAEEGDDWQSVELSPDKCAVCDRRRLPYANRFHVPDDGVLRTDAGVWGFADHALLLCAGILLAREDVAGALVESGLTGFELREASVSRLDDEAQAESLPRYRWVVITGRCDTTPIWERVVGSCSACGVALTEKVNRTTRSWALEATHPPDVDICRAREASAGVIVSGRIRDVLLRHDPRVADIVAFKPVAFAEPSGGAV